MSLSEAVRSRRQALGLSQKGLGDKAGVDQQYVARIELGSVRSPRYLPRIAAALRCAVTDLDPGAAYAVRLDDTVGEAGDLADEMGVDRGDVEFVIRTLVERSAQLGSQLGFSPTVRQTFQHLLARAADADRTKAV